MDAKHAPGALRRAPAVLAAALALAAAACTSPTGTIEPGADGAEAYEPPLAFGPALIETAAEAHLVDGDRLYTLDADDGVREGSVTVRSVETGDLLETVPVGDIAANIALYQNQTARFGTAGGRVALAYARVVEDAAAPAGQALAVSLLNAENGSTLWESRFETAGAVAAESPWAASAGIAIQSVGDRVVVTAAYEDAATEAWILDAADGERIGAELDVVPSLDHDGVVAGQRRLMAEAPAVAAYEIDSGTELWTADLTPGRPYRVADLGGGLLAVHEYTYDYASELHEAAGEYQSVAQSTRVFDAASGEVVVDTEHEAETAIACLAGGADLIACADTEGTYLATFDAATGEPVWSSAQTPADWRRPDTLGAVTGHVLYTGDSYDGWTAAIDGRTGEVLAEGLPAVFTEVGPGHGLVLSDDLARSPVVAVHPAIADRGGELGVEVSTATDGAFVEAVAEGSPADAAGLRFGDLIVAVDEHTITSQDDLVDALRRYAPGDTVEIRYLREGESATVQVELVGG